MHSRIISCCFSIFMLVVMVSCATQKESYFIVNDAMLSHADRHSTLQSATDNRSAKLTDKDFVITGHRVSFGTGVVLAARTYSSGSSLKTDQAAFKKVTIYLPSGKLQGRFEFSSDEGVVAYWSNGNASLLGMSGCYGYADRGSIELSEEIDRRIIVSVKMRFNLVSPAGWDKDCEPVQLDETWTLQRKSLAELTPWEGKAAENILDEAFY